MREKIVHSATGITIIGAGRSSVRQIARAVALAPCVVAADGGGRTALAAGLMPEAIIGDMDSLSRGDWGKFPPERLHKIAEQDSTDFEKCLYSIDAPFVLALGVTGSRLDHSLAAMNILTRQTEQPVLILTAHEVIFLCPPKLCLNL
ncbi:MAG: thiamine pyrophosphokinase, partial [Alphaproteobacteria bacterium]|nr:thiamine pyrophosphokinase [Alphaproteobacteria bacterium]